MKSIGDEFNDCVKSATQVQLYLDSNKSNTTDSYSNDDFVILNNVYCEASHGIKVKYGLKYAYNFSNPDVTIYFEISDIGSDKLQFLGNLLKRSRMNEREILPKYKWRIDVKNNNKVKNFSFSGSLEKYQIKRNNGNDESPQISIKCWILITDPIKDIDL